MTRGFLPFKKSNSTVVGYSSGFAFLPPSIPFMTKSSSYAVSKMATARFYEFLAVEHPDLNVFVVHPGVIPTPLYEKGGLHVVPTVDKSMLDGLKACIKDPANPFLVELASHFTVWLATSEAKPFSGRFLFANWDVEQLKSTVAKRLEADPVYLTTSLGGFPFN